MSNDQPSMVGLTIVLMLVEPRWLGLTIVGSFVKRFDQQLDWNVAGKAVKDSDCAPGIGARWAPSRVRSVLV